MTDDRTPEGVVVGLDGSGASMPALRWAIAHADLFGPPQPVLVWHYPAAMWSTAFVGPDTLSTETMQQAAEETIVATLEGVDADDILSPRVLEGDPAAQLVGAAADAALLVVGSRGLGAVRGRILGSVGCYCADHASVPVVIVPDRRESVSAAVATPRRLVVGIDGSENGDAALRWALTNSRADDEIVAVSAWSPSAGVGYEAIDVETELLEKAATEIVDETVHRISAAMGVGSTRVTRQVERGDPRAILRKLAYEADLVVVGARGRSGLPHLFLGSTASSLAHRPVCPTAIVPAGRRDPEPED